MTSSERIFIVVIAGWAAGNLIGLAILLYRDRKGR